MATFVMFGRYTPEALKGATLGKIDLVVVTEFPGDTEAMQASMALTKLTGIGFMTAPAVPVDEFDKLMAEA